MKYLVATVLLGLSVSAALAQAQTPPTSTGPGTPAVATPATTNTSAPIKGANSFTEAQAKARIGEAGYSDVSALTKDGNGVWRGKATRSGATSDVSLDYQGNVAPK